MVQNASSSQHNEFNDASPQHQDQPTNDTTLLNWQGEELCGLNVDNSLVAANTRAKKRAFELDQAADKGKETGT